ncbi:MAG TPA: HEAT repeat domain-containing protein [Gemmataceae bacterium]|jgi:HEAT repeat protein|nr:HEAT repeat domain-containing protein [Gemmataceae bacterium]
MPRASCLPVLITLAVIAAIGSRSPADQDTIASDEQLLKLNKIATDNAGLLAFLRKNSLSDEELRQVESQIRQLGHGAFKTREDATSTLIASGMPALSLLRRATHDRDPEIARRADACVEAIERERVSQAALVAAAIRVLAQRKPPGAAAALLAYLPFNEDEWAEEEIFRTLKTLGLRDGKLDPVLLTSLHSLETARRGAAAYVVARHGDPEQRSVVRNLLIDPDPKVRLWTAQGLLGAGDKSALPTLIALLGEGPIGLASKAEELLSRVAGDLAPHATMSHGAMETRLKARDAWAAWWRDQGQRLDLTHFEDVPQQLGLTLVAEMDSNKVWEFGPDGKPRWQLQNLQGPMDAQLLPNGHVLIAEYQGRRISEHDIHGRMIWSRPVNGSPIGCQRLANGNTFIATHNSMFEVTREGKEVQLPALPGGLFIFSALKLANGHIVCIVNPGFLKEFDASGKQLKTIRVGKNNGGWCGVEALPGGRYLVSLFGEGKVVELDNEGKKTWECAVVGASHATRLPNGHTLVASMMNRRIVEVDRDGKTVKEAVTDGRPWKVRRR